MVSGPRSSFMGLAEELDRRPFYRAEPPQGYSPILVIKYAKKVDDRVGATKLIIKLKLKVVERYNFASASFGSVEG